jgi:hypothetical protein
VRVQIMDSKIQENQLPDSYESVNYQYSGDPNTGHLNAGNIRILLNNLGSGFRKAKAIPKPYKLSGFRMVCRHFLTVSLDSLIIKNILIMTLFYL